MSIAQLLPTWRNIRGRPIVDARDFGIIAMTDLNLYPDQVDEDNAAALNLAWAQAVADQRALFIHPGQYMIKQPLVFTAIKRVDVIQLGVVYPYDGAEGDILTYGGLGNTYPTNYETFFGAQLHGGKVVNASTLHHINNTWPPLRTNRNCFCFRNFTNTSINIEGANYGAIGVKLFSDNSPILYNTFRLCGVGACDVALKLVSSGDNGPAYDNAVVSGSQLNGDTAAIVCDDSATTWKGFYSWIFNHASFEKPGGTPILLQGTALTNWSFRDCWFESSGFTFDLSGTNDICFDRGQQSGLPAVLPAGAYRTGQQIREYTFVLSGDLSVANDLTNHVRMSYAGQAVKISAIAKTAPTGQAAIFRVNKNGSPIQDTLLQIAAGATVGTSTAFNAAGTFSVGDYLSIDVTQIGSGTVGADVAVTLTTQVAF
jgi:hypothetical protein